MAGSIFIILTILITTFVGLEKRFSDQRSSRKYNGSKRFEKAADKTPQTPAYSDAMRLKGKMLENEIKQKLLSLSQEYCVYNDVYLNVNDRSVQIDHIIISPYGVFVIETKNYNGKIYGADDSEYWTKYINEKEYKFRNPLKQNYSHVYSLQCILGLPRNYFIPIVVFSDNAKIKCETNEFVVYSNQLQSVIHSFRVPILPPNMIQTSVYVLNNAIILNQDRAAWHVNSVNQYIQAKNDLINQGICPRCKGKLIERNGKYGRFLGCSNYPYCKFTKDI